MHVLPVSLPFVCAAELTPGVASRPRARLTTGVRRLENAFDTVFDARHNPFRHLGALSFLLLGIAVLTGIYVYVWFDTGVEGAYRSVAGLRGLGGFMRSMHRYASDAFALGMVLHLLREWLYGRTHGFRWFSWVSGVPLLWLAFAAGVVGFWLVWDELAQFSLTASLEWLDALPLFGEPLARNVLYAGSLDDRFFSLLVFLHIGLPLLLLLGVWLHIQRIARPDTWPSPRLAGGTLAMLCLLSVLVPIRSAAPADLAHVGGLLSVDWFYLAPHVLMYASSPLVLWSLAAAATLFLALLPLLPHAPRAPVARVSPDHCNGCQRCFADCPFGAITMQPHPKGKPGALVATVDTALCAGCGICAGACPSSTPLRREVNPVSGIDMPQRDLAALRQQLDSSLAALLGGHGIVVFGCGQGAELDGLAGADTAVVPLLCAGQLAPAFVQYALRRGADRVLIVACREDGCEFRLGARWTAQRLAGEREPRLRRSVPAHAWRYLQAGPGERERVARELAALRGALAEETDHA